MKNTTRKQNGSFIVTTVAAAIMIVLPLGLYAFEVARANLASCQLRVATDSAALAAASYLQNVNFDSTAEQTKAKEKALRFIQRNLVAGSSLKDARISSNVQQDSPGAGASTVDFIFNKDNTVTAVAAFGLEPAFGAFLGIKSVPVRVNSTAGAGGLEGDICIIVDVSGSMSEDSTSVVFKRSFAGGKLSHSIAGASTTPSSFGPSVQNSFLVPDPKKVDFNKTQHLKSLQNASDEAKLAALVEAKLGNLENATVYAKSHADVSALKELNFTPTPGCQDDYQRLALGATQPLADEKDVLSSFIEDVSQNDAHFALVTFSQSVSTNEGHDNFETRKGFRLPQVDLNKENGRGNDVNTALEATPTFSSTNTGDSVLKAISILNGNQHRQGVQKTIVLLTDGLANTGSSPIVASRLAKESSIKLLTVGFFHSDFAMRSGKPLLNQMVATCGNGSKAFFAPDIPTLKEVLSSISQGDVSLINR